MFEFDAGKIIIVGVIALIFIPPKDLPRVLRQVGQFVGKMRRMAAEFQGQFMDAMREADMADLKREAQKLSEAARVSTGLDTMRALDRDMTGVLDRPHQDALPQPSPSPTEPSTTDMAAAEHSGSEAAAAELSSPTSAPAEVAKPHAPETSVRQPLDHAVDHPA